MIEPDLSQQAGNPDAARTLYQIDLATAQQENLVRGNTNLTPEQMAVELRRIALEQAKAAAVGLGQDLPPEPPPLPTNPPPEPAEIRSHPYVLGTGESANSIATTFGVSIESIKQANPGVDLRRLKRGDVIQVPDLLAK